MTDHATQGAAPAPLLDPTIINCLWRTGAQPGIATAVRLITEASPQGMAGDDLAGALMLTAETAFSSGAELAGAACQALAGAGIPLDTPIDPATISVTEAATARGTTAKALAFDTARPKATAQQRIARAIVAIDRWDRDVWQRHQELDPDNGIDWADMATGWLLAFGVITDPHAYSGDTDRPDDGELVLGLANGPEYYNQIKHTLLALVRGGPVTATDEVSPPG